MSRLTGNENFFSGPVEGCKPYPGDNGYFVSPLGEIFSAKWRSPKKLAQNIRGPGYLSVTTYSEGKVKARYVHRMVAETYLQKPESASDVHHINHDKTDNRVSNLKWVTRAENLSEACKHYGVNNINQL